MRIFSFLITLVLGIGAWASNEAPCCGTSHDLMGLNCAIKAISHSLSAVEYKVVHTTAGSQAKSKAHIEIDCSQLGSAVRALRLLKEIQQEEDSCVRQRRNSISLSCPVLATSSNGVPINPPAEIKLCPNPSFGVCNSKNMGTDLSDHDKRSAFFSKAIGRVLSQYKNSDKIPRPMKEFFTQKLGEKFLGCLFTEETDLSPYSYFGNNCSYYAAVPVMGLGQFQISSFLQTMGLRLPDPRSGKQSLSENERERPFNLAAGAELGMAQEYFDKKLSQWNAQNSNQATVQFVTDIRTALGTLVKNPSPPLLVKPRLAPNTPAFPIEKMTYMNVIEAYSHDVEFQIEMALRHLWEKSQNGRLQDRKILASAYNGNASKRKAYSESVMRCTTGR